MNTVLHSFNYSLDFLEEQIADISPEQMVAQPQGVSNHPAWTIGHLSYVLDLIGTVIGIESSLSEKWLKHYGPGSRPVSDSGVYQDTAAVLAILREHRDRIIERVRRLDDATLDSPFPDPGYRDVFPTLRHALTQVLVGHTAFHLGQIALWRKAVGLAPMKRSYE